MKRPYWLIVIVLAIAVSGVRAGINDDTFRNPPDDARPGVYWYFMDGNLDRGEMVDDLESMKKAGLGSAIFLEVNVGVPRGPVKFMSEKWQGLYANAVRQAERLGIDIELGVGPGWSGSGGPWVPPEESMQHLVYSEVTVQGPQKFDRELPKPEQRQTRWHKRKSPFYEDVAVFAFPSCEPVISDIDEKALYERDPYTSRPGVKPHLPSPASHSDTSASKVIAKGNIVDLTDRLQSDGRLQWDVPSGEWTILRMGRRTTGSSTRPAPKPGRGFEHDKFDEAALESHWKNYAGELLEEVGPRSAEDGWTRVHLDSWEMGAQNWTPDFREEFKKRRGYDPRPYFTAFSGRAVESVEISERFLWDVRATAQELILENYAGHLKELAAEHGLGLSIEPYDMNPTADLNLGSIADVPMCEFWSAGMGFDSSYSCIEASSIAHTMGRSVVAAEAFTKNTGDRWQQYPWSMKNQGDWAFCIGINRFFYHTFAHKPLGEQYRPGMTMGPYGIHWDRGQTWWPMVDAYHEYVTRCSHLLQQGVQVSDILYLTPEGAPHVFRPPGSALAGKGPMPDKKGYRFDGCSPRILEARAEVRDGRIAFPGGTSYRLMVLPNFKTMTPQFLAKIEELVGAGATVVGSPPSASPSLTNYPQCDKRVRSLARKLWGSLGAPDEITRRDYGQGCIYWGGELSVRTGTDGGSLYPHYDATASLLSDRGVHEDFVSEGPLRYTHRRLSDGDLYFVSNKSDERIRAECTFRVERGAPELWNPVTGEKRVLPKYSTHDGLTTVPMKFYPYQSFFVFFGEEASRKTPEMEADVNFAEYSPAGSIEGSWDVSFDPEWGGPEHVVFDELQDWTEREERGIKYYSGIATYRKTFDMPPVSADRVYLDLGTVNDMARVRLNGKTLGVVWCAPWRVDISDALRHGENVLEIDVANRWANRLYGDRQEPDKNVRTLQWESGLLAGKTFKAGRYTFATAPGPNKLLPSGLRGPVRIMVPQK